VGELNVRPRHKQLAKGGVSMDRVTEDAFEVGGSIFASLIDRGLSPSAMLEAIEIAELAVRCEFQLGLESMDAPQEHTRVCGAEE
jgi:hypothetical protein